MTSLRLPLRLSRRVCQQSTPGLSSCAVQICHQHRHKSDKADQPGMSEGELSPILKDYYAKRPEALQNVIAGQTKDQKTKVQFGKMPPDSIFGKDEAAAAPERDDQTEGEKRGLALSDREEYHDDRSLDILNRVLDPLPHKRWQYEREQIIKHARRGWRLTKAEHLQRTERRSALNSMPLKTSRKKLGALARQISGKSIDEALLQMRFSKKRSATEVAKHLEEARDHAIVRWGMGLGKAEEREGEPITIKLNNGTKRRVTDRTALYIEHAMVRSQRPSWLPEFRARGKTNMIKRKWTTLRIVLREEHTRIRESQEREERKARRTPFEPLADRPITQQRQYVLW